MQGQPHWDTDVEPHHGSLGLACPGFPISKQHYRQVQRSGLVLRAALYLPGSAVVLTGELLYSVGAVQNQ